jgi:hypothetical protein
LALKQVSGEQKHYFHLWRLQKSLMALPLMIFSVPTSENIFLLSYPLHSNTRPWKDHFKCDLRSVKDLCLQNDLRSDQDQNLTSLNIDGVDLDLDGEDFDQTLRVWVAFFKQ